MKKELKKWIKNEALKDANNKFKNKTNLKSCGINDYDRITVMHDGVHHITSKISNDKQIVNKVKDYEQFSFEKLESSFDSFINDHNHSDGAFFTDILSNYGEQRLFTEPNLSNMKRYFSRFYNNKDCENLMEEIKGIRKDFYNYKNPTVKNLCEYFDLHASAYSRRKNKNK